MEPPVYYIGFNDYFAKYRRWIRIKETLVRGNGWIVVRFRVKWWVRLLGLRDRIERKFRSEINAAIPEGFVVEFWSK